MFLVTISLVSAGTPAAQFRYWIDCDSDIDSCETGCGFANAWIKQDAAVVTNMFGGSLGEPIPGIGEFSDNYEECCGDDSYEKIITTQCNASREQGPRCCTNETAYNLLDGACTEEGKCPDIMRGAPVWVAESNLTNIANWNALLLGDGYCCTGVPGTHGPLCGLDVGCYLDTNSLPFAEEIGQYPPLGPEFKQWCSTNQTHDPYCVAQACDDTLELCEESEVCNETRTRVTHTGNVVYCPPGSYTKTEESNYATACYPKLWAGCDAIDYKDCEEVLETNCKPTGNCEVRCQQYVNGTIYSCQEICDDYSCKTETTYRGPNCRYEPVGRYNALCETMQERDCSKHTTVEVVDSDRCVPNVNPPDYYEVQTCSDELYCDNLKCVDLTNHSADANQYCWEGTSANNYTQLINEVVGGEKFVSPLPTPSFILRQAVVVLPHAKK